MFLARVILAFVIVLTLVLGLHAEDYPSRPITLILPLGAGGAMDVLARGQFEPQLKERLGKPVIVENRTGGGTVIAATAVAKSPPDGYTLFFTPAGTLTTNVTLYKQLPYDPAKDFVPIAMTSTVAFILVINPSLPVNSMADLVKYAKEHPGQLTYGSTGIGATPHLAFEMLQRMTGIKLNHVPYRGMPQATSDVVAGHIQMVFTDPTVGPPLIAEGKLRALAVSSLTRISSAPNVPTLNELGFKDFEAVSWHMIVGPAGIPKDIVNRLNATFKAIGATPEFRAQVERMGLTAVDTPPPDELKRYLDREITRWGQLVKDVGIAGTQ